jgi:hypothetical protein
MKISRGLKYTWLICFFLFVLVSGVDGNASGMIGVWEPFKAKKELSSYVSGIEDHVIPSSQDELAQMDTIISGYPDTADRKYESLPHGLRLHNVTISFSRVMMDQMKIDMRQSTVDENEKLSTMKSLPSMFINSSYRDTLESLGKIFEPQVNLSIEF